MVHTATPAEQDNLVESFSGDKPGTDELTGAARPTNLASVLLAGLIAAITGASAVMALASCGSRRPVHLPTG
jgi:hypothetical protein